MEIAVQLSFYKDSSVGNSTCTDVQILNDSVLESAETFMVLLIAVDGNVTEISSAFSTAIVTIMEDNVDCKFLIFRGRHALKFDC